MALNAAQWHDMLDCGAQIYGFIELTSPAYLRYLEADPMLLVSAPGSREEKTERHSRFHALNQAIVQLVSHSPSIPPPLSLTFNCAYVHRTYNTRFG